MKPPAAIALMLRRDGKLEQRGTSCFDVSALSEDRLAGILSDAFAQPAAPDPLAPQATWTNAELREFLQSARMNFGIVGRHNVDARSEACEHINAVLRALKSEVP